VSDQDKILFCGKIFAKSLSLFEVEGFFCASATLSDQGEKEKPLLNHSSKGL